MTQVYTCGYTWLIRLIYMMIYMTHVYTCLYTPTLLSIYTDPSGIIHDDIYDVFTYITHPYCAAYVSVHVTRLIHTHAVTHSYAFRDQSIRVPILIHIYDSAISCNMCLRTRNATHSYACRDSFVRVPWPVYTRAVTHSHFWLMHIVQHMSWYS